MKKLIGMFVVAGALMVTSAFAQQAGPQGGTPQDKAHQRQGGFKRMEHMQDEIFAKLDLKQDQKDKIKALRQKLQDKMKEFRKTSQNVDRSTLRDKVQAMRKEYTDGLKSVLTTDQQKKYETMLKDAMKKLRQERKAGQKPDGKGGL